MTFSNKKARSSENRESVKVNTVRTPLPARKIRPRPLLATRDYWLLAFLTGAALALRLVALNEGLWYDEISSLINYFRLPFADILTTYNGRNNHVLYSALAHLSIALFGESAWSIRLPAALLGAATIPAAYYLGLQLTNRREALLATVFLICSYHHVWFSQNARGYSGLLFFAVLLSIILIRLLCAQKPSWATVVAYSTVAVLGVWIHLTFALLLLAHGAIWMGLTFEDLRAGEKSVNWRAATAIAIGTMLAFIPYAGVLTALNAHYVDEAIANAALDTKYIASTDFRVWLLSEIWNALGLIMPGGAVIIPLMVLLVVAVCSAGLWSYAQQGWLSWSILTLPIMVVVLVFFVLREMLYPRFLLCCMVFMLLIGVRGGYVLSNRLMPSLPVKWVSALGLAIALASASLVPRAWQPKQDTVAAVNYIKSHMQQGDALVCRTLSRRMLAFYSDLPCETAMTLDELLAIESTHERTWYVYTLPLFFVSKNIWERFKSEYTVEMVASSTINRGEIVVLSHTRKPRGK
jgi:4-amino-4-deoxy-L-arabinose transferase-like glycosyltransferase